MNKSEAKAVQRIVAASKHFDADATITGYAARSLSALIRCAMTKRSKLELLEVARELNVANHPEFII